MNSRRDGYISLFGSIYITLFIGNYYLWGNISAYVVSYFHHPKGTYPGDANATLNSAALVIPLGVAALGFGNVIGTYLFNIMHVKLIVLIGSIVSLGAMLIASFTHNWRFFLFLYAFVFPFGTGLFYTLPMICGWEWFPEKQGFITGLISGSFGLASFIFGFITTALVNRENVMPKIPEDGTNTHDLLYP